MTKILFLLTQRGTQAVLATVLLGVLAAGCADPHASELYVNGRIWTANEDEPWADAMAVRGEYIIYIGSAAAAEGVRGEDTRVIDLEGAFVMPGFIDNRTHFLQGGFNLASVELEGVDSSATGTLKARLAMLERAQQHALSLGVTQVHDVGSYGGWDDLEAFRVAEREDWLSLRIYSHVPLSSWRRLTDFINENGLGSQRLWWGGLTGTVHGGLVVTDTVAMRRDIMDAYGAGLHLSVSAIEDRANDWLLGVYAEARANTAGSMRQVLRIEGAQHLSPAAFGRFAELGVVPSMQPYHAIDDGRWAEARIGEPIRTTYAFRSLLDSGAGLTFGSDWTAAPLNPLLGVYAAVTRRTIDGAHPDGWVPEEKITLEEALVAYTRSGAVAGRSDGFSGVLKAGRLADFVMLSENLFEMDPVAIPDVEVVQTVIGGKIVYTRE